MSKFSIDLEGLTLPDAIAAVVEAWYEAQNADNADSVIAVSSQSPSNIKSKRKNWKACTFYVQPSTFEQLQRYVWQLKLEGKDGDQSTVVDSALQMWMDDAP